MSQNNQSTSYAGLDVAKDSLALDFQGGAHALSNDAKGHARLVRLLRAGPNVHVVIEATGGYEQPAVRALHAAGLALSVVEPGRVRAFARALGQRAKTDPIDAAVLSAFGRAVAPAPTAAPSAPQQRLGELVRRRRQLVEFVVAESNRSVHYTDKLPRRQAAALLRTLRAQIAACEKAIAAQIAEDEAMQARATRLQEVPGVGATTAATLLAEMPELGTLSDEGAAALAGVAPYNATAAPLPAPGASAAGGLPCAAASFWRR